jgi:hypothetical protein
MKGKDSVMARRRRRILPRLLTAVLDGGFRFLNRFVTWHRWPVELLREINLLALRHDLRRFNLHDASARRAGRPPRAEASGMEYLYERTIDGSFNDLSDPAMGRAGERFGRNVPLEEAHPDRDVLTPSPRAISRRLLARGDFVPATTLNLLAAAWIQFQVHDWFVHDTVEGKNEIEIPLDRGDDWTGAPPRIARTREDLPRLSGAPPAFANLNSHWWDASQIYGCDAGTARRLRSAPDWSPLPDGKLALDPKGLLVMVPDPKVPGREVPLTGFAENWWVGLELLHTLFTREHNAICDALRARHPSWTGDQVHRTARLVNAALMAKIHTIEWTPAILSTKTLERAMNTNWRGLPRGGFANGAARLFASILGEDELLEGITRTSADHHTAPYALTEEFVAVYRMHPLMPDTYTFRALGGSRPEKPFGLMEVAFGKARAPMAEGFGMADLFHSFGTSHPGAIVLRNYPNTLRDLTLPGGRRIDLAAVDIVRDRERGVPKYNHFRRRLRMPRVGSFRAMARGDREVESALREIYGDVDKVDAMVGLFSEKPPDGFGFSDTAFRIFILMASRRLKSDRFLTDDYRAEIYTPLGVEWVETNTLATVLLRHHPELMSVPPGAAVFRPWPGAGRGRA